MDFNFRKLNVYQYAKALVVQVYQLVKNFPREETYALSDQLRRAAVSIPSNIVEGTVRTSDKEKLHFISIAYGSLMEVLCQLEIALSLGYIAQEEFNAIESNIVAVSKLLSGLRASIQKSLNSQQESLNTKHSTKVTKH